MAKKELDWLKRNKEFLRLGRIAKAIKINRRVLEGTVNEQTNPKGIPFKIPDKYHEALKEIITSIQKK